MKNWAIYAVVIIGFAIYGAMTDVDRDDSGAIVGEGSVGAFDIRVGDCFDDTDSLENISSLPGVPCTEPHDNEAFAVFDVDLESYPGDDEMGTMANDACMARFESFVGTDYNSSVLDVFAMYPSPESWKGDDREVVCAVYEMNAEKLVGSVAGLGL